MGRDASQPGMGVHETISSERYEEVALARTGCDEKQVASPDLVGSGLACSFKSIAASQHKKARDARITKTVALGNARRTAEGL